VPESLSQPLAGFASALGAADAPLATLYPLFAAIDAWVRAAAAHCIERDPTLDIAGALPGPLGLAPLTFVRDARVPAPLAAD
jgi:hypothetical protein